MKNRNKCIVVTCIGDFFKNHLTKVYPMLKGYSNKCNADLIIQDTPPDASFKHNLMSQRLLMPERYKQYEHLLMLDLDIFISDSCPNIFDDVIDSGVGFSAIENPINSSEYEYVCEHVWGVPKRHNPKNPYTGAIDSQIKGINGGVMYVNNLLMKDLFHEFYFNNSTEWYKNTVIMNNEETPMLWLASANNMFSAADKKYNYQMLYHLAKDYKDVIKIYKGFRGKIYRKTYKKLPILAVNNIFGSRYKDSVSSAIDSNDIVHFAGGIPYPYFKL